MAEETPFIIPVDALEEGPSGSDPKEPPVEINTSRPTTENHTPNHTLGNASKDVVGDLIMQFVVQNFEQINTMYSAFSSKRKEINYISQFNDDDLPGMGPWNADMEGFLERAAQKTPEEIAISEKLSKKNQTIADNSNGHHKQNLVTNSDFYYVPFTFRETEMNVLDQTKGKNQIEWKPQNAKHKEVNEILMTSMQQKPLHYQPEALRQDTEIAFLSDDLVPRHCAREDPLVIRPDIGGNEITPTSVQRKTHGKKEGVVLNLLYLDQQVAIGTNLPMTLKEEQKKLLYANQDIFAWSPLDMTEILRDLLKHKLNIHPCTFLIWQKKRILAKERKEAITQEVSNLVEVRILREVYFPQWDANPVILRKNDGTWHMSIDFTSLNKACPKVSYPLYEIDQKIESLEGFKFKCFLNAYKGYHQKQMAKEDEEKTSFHT
nr:reverse transcriptase domain-containing protein [Tanacetum cinerariifolium]